MKNIDKTFYKCRSCGDVLRSDGCGTLLWCSCGRLGVDGRYDSSGEGYLRVIGDECDYEVVVGSA